MKKIDNKLNNIIKKYPIYENYINNYFKENKLEYFKDFSLDYNRIPKDCRTNNYLENYNGYIKNQLGKNHIINWVNFIHFLKLERQSSTEKITNPKNKILKLDFKSDVYEINNNIEEKAVNNENKEKEKVKDLKNKICSNDIEYNNIINTKIGIININSSCFINSSIQVLIHCKPLMENFFKKINSLISNNFSLSYKIYKICKDM